MSKVEDAQVSESIPQTDDFSGDEYLSNGDELIDGNDLDDEEKQMFEESLDLDMVKASSQIWLMRLPRFLADKWRDRENLRGQDLGVLRINKTNKTISMHLNGADASMDELPHTYDVKMTNRMVENQYIFSEANLKKFDRKVNQELSEMDEKEMIKNFHQQLEEEKNKSKLRKQELVAKGIGRANKKRKKFRNRSYVDQDGRDRFIPYVKTIPKKTGIVGTIVHECQVIPSVGDANYAKLVEARRRQIYNKDKPTITLLEELPGVTMSNIGLSLKSDTSNFLKVGKKDKNQNRSLRLPKKDLLDILFKLFDEYDYWTLKGLKDRTKQPEVYLKECLEHVGQMVKRGPYALKYTLKPEFKKLKEADRRERLGDFADDDDDDDEDDIEMEDVL